MNNKIDLCKIIGVEELQEFMLDGCKSRIEDNRLKIWSENFKKWGYDDSAFNYMTRIINEKEIEIIPKVKLTETEYEQLKAIKILFKDSTEIFINDNHFGIIGETYQIDIFKRIKFSSLDNRKYNIGELLKQYESVNK